MTQHNSLNIKLSNSQFEILKSAKIMKLSYIYIFSKLVSSVLAL